MADTFDLDQRLLNLAGPTGGVCTRGQLLAAGLTSTSITRRCQAGLLDPVGRGLYLVAGADSPWTHHFIALMGVPNSVLSHLTAAELLSLPVEPDPDGIHVLTTGRGRSVDRVTVHRTRSFSSDEAITLPSGLTVTTPVRTICDLAAIVRPARLRHIIQTVVRDGTVSPADLIDRVEPTRTRGVPGAKRLAAVVHDLWDDATPLTRSALEARTLDLLDDHNIAGFTTQVRPPWYDGCRGTVDFAHPGLGIILEADGRRWHRRDQEMTEDRRRDRLAAGHGWVTIRVTWDDVVARPAETVDQIRAVVEARRTRAA